MTNNFAKAYFALNVFASHMSKIHNISDGLLTARVIGEFSAGKTRFLRELLGDSIPPSLYPVSSLERQTRLPLEITYGPVPELTVVQRPNDYDINEKTVVLQTLSEFPDREATMNFDPMKHRLRLALPEDRFILSEGDGFSDDKSAKRLFLIDMPGWNSGDDLLAEGDPSQIMAGFHNLALVYVVSALRLDGLKNSERLQHFLRAFSEADFVGEPHLIVIITHCSANEVETLQEKVRRQVNAMWAELGEDSGLQMDLYGIDFEKTDASALKDFRDSFWRSLLSPLRQPASVGSHLHPWVHPLRNWPESWRLEKPIIQSQALLSGAREVLGVAKSDDGYLPGMNMTKLSGLSQADMHARLSRAWSRQIGSTIAATQPSLCAMVPELDANHPLSVWWRECWLPQMKQALGCVDVFLHDMAVALRQVTPQTENLNQFLASRLDASHEKAKLATRSSFTQISDSLVELPKDVLPEQFLATLLHLNLIQMRYQDHVNELA